MFIDYPRTIYRWRSSACLLELLLCLSIPYDLAITFSLYTLSVCMLSCRIHPVRSTPNLPAQQDDHPLLFTEKKHWRMSTARRMGTVGTIHMSPTTGDSLRLILNREPWRHPDRVARQLRYARLRVARKGERASVRSRLRLVGSRGKRKLPSRTAGHKSGVIAYR